MALTDSQKDATIVVDYSGSSPYFVTLAENCRKGDVLGYSSGWKRALATTGGVIQGRFVALADGVTGDTIPVSSHCVIGGRYSGATLDANVYVAEGTSNGKVTETAPSTGGDANTIIGRAVSATEVFFFIGNRVDSTA